MSNMVSIRINTNTARVVKTVPDSYTPKQLMQESDVDFSESVVHLDGVPVSIQDMNTSFSTLGITESAILACVVKTVNR